MATKILDNGTLLTLGIVGVVAAVGAANKAGLYGSRAQKDNAGGYVCENDRYCHYRDTFASVQEFQDMCRQVFGQSASLTRRGSDYIDEHGEVVLRSLTD